MQITIREPGSAITHFIAMMAALLAAAPLAAKAFTSSGGATIAPMMIFIASMVLLYGASTLYHSVNFSGKKLKVFRRIDHMMIFVLIAGSYTPVCMITLDKTSGMWLLTVVWSIAIVGMLVKLFWITCPKWFSSILYIAMGWMCLFVFGPLLDSLSFAAFMWLLMGGIAYTAGGILYALKIPALNKIHKYFGSHEIFHVFVMIGSLCHFVFMYCYVA